VSFRWFRTGKANEVGFVTAIKFGAVVAVRIFAFNRLNAVAFVVFLRVRQAVERLQSSASAIAESLSPSSAFSKMRVRVIFCALCLP
jgi:hypothetical protein